MSGTLGMYYALAHGMSKIPKSYLGTEEITRTKSSKKKKKSRKQSQKSRRKNR